MTILTPVRFYTEELFYSYTNTSQTHSTTIRYRIHFFAPSSQTEHLQDTVSICIKLILPNLPQTRFPNLHFLSLTAWI